MVVLCMTLALIGVVVLRRLVPFERMKENNEFAGFTIAIVGAVYGVYLAFTVVVVWEQFRSADQNATAEAVHLSEVWRDVQTLAPEFRNPIQDKLYAYAGDVVDREWPLMATGKGPDAQTAATYEELWRTVYAARAGVSTPADAVFFQAAIDQMNELGMQRRLRLLSSESKLPTVMWMLLIGGGLVAVGFTYCIGTRHALVQGLITAALTGLIVFTLMLVSALQHPFAGQIRIKADAMESVHRSLATRGLQQKVQEGATVPSFGKH